MWAYLLWALWIRSDESEGEKRLERSVNWPEAQGRVLGSRLVWSHVEIMYEYWVFAERYESVYKIRLGPVLISSVGLTGVMEARRLNREAKRNMADFPVGSKVIVRYNRSNPFESVLYCKGEVRPPAEGPKIEPHFLTLK